MRVLAVKFPGQSRQRREPVTNGARRHTLGRPVLHLLPDFVSSDRVPESSAEASEPRIDFVFSIFRVRKSRLYNVDIDWDVAFERATCGYKALTQKDGASLGLPRLHVAQTSAS